MAWRCSHFCVASRSTRETGDELFCAGALGGVEDNVGAGDVVVGDDLEGAVAQDEVDAVGGLVGRGQSGDVLGGGGAR